MADTTLVDLADLFGRARVGHTRETALNLARAGLPVFPCLPGGKRPLTKHGFLDATTDPATISRWWSRRPGANIGMPTGPLSGWDVVDIDHRESGDGHAIWSDVAPRLGLECWAVSVSTPSGGTHLYYPADQQNPQGSWACGAAHVDFRGAGGYIIVPPSEVDVDQGLHVPYTLAGVRRDPRPIAATRLRDVLDPGLAQRRLAARCCHPDQPVDPSRLAAWVASRPEGERNQGLFWAACRLAEAGHSVNETITALAGAADDAGMTGREIHTTVTSAYRHTNPAAPATAAPAVSSPVPSSSLAVML